LVRNFREQPQAHQIVLHAPAGITATPAKFEGKVAEEATGRYPFKLAIAPGVKDGVYLVSFDITLDGQRHGELFDMIVQVGNPPPGSTAAGAGTKPGY
jgi:hypothetical protein